MVIIAMAPVRAAWATMIRRCRMVIILSNGTIIIQLILRRFRLIWNAATGIMKNSQYPKNMSRLTEFMAIYTVMSRLIFYF
ncbi:MAG: hypothetical protein HYR83_03265 [Planctomycetes bacterium]|nr:hypothetical protein [Planctomycetota bacterium]